MFCTSFWTFPRRPKNSHLPAYEYGTDRVFRNVGIKKFRPRGITQKKASFICTLHKLVLTSVDACKLHCFVRQRRRLSCIVIQGAEQFGCGEGRGGWLVVGGVTIIVNFGDKHLTTVVWDATLYVLVNTF